MEVPIDRQAWLAERRAAVVAAYDAEASSYDSAPYPAAMQREFIARLLASCPPDGLVLDAPCGTGQYFPLVASAGCRVIGIDQSAGMLDQARARGIALELQQTGLRELAFDADFDAVMTVDAMENVFPEDWPRVLANLSRALRSEGTLYLTVEEVTDEEIDTAFAALTGRGLPVVRGEVIEGDVAGYHYYPGREQVRAWLDAERLEIIDQATEPQDGWAYWHLLLRSRSDGGRPGSMKPVEW